MPNYDFKTAKAVLNENDKDRLLACYLNITDMQAVDWKKAANDFGSASVESFRVMIRTALKKIDKADAAAAAANGGGSDAAAATPKSNAKKRKATGSGDADDDDEGAATTPVKKRGRPSKGSAKKAKTETKAEAKAEKEGDGEGEAVEENGGDVEVKEEMDFD